MSFVYPEFLYAFLVLLIPIIIHLFQFKRFKTLYFSSIQFLQALTQESKSTKKIKHVVLLSLRLLAFSALVIAFAQPFFPEQINRKSGTKNVLAIYLDNTFSMSAQGSNGTLLQQGKETVRELLEKAEPSANFMLITNDLKGKDQRLKQKTEVLDQLEEIDFTSSTKDLGVVLSTMKNNMDQLNIDGERQYILLSDFQKSSSLLENVQLDTFAKYHPYQLLPQRFDNLFVDSVWFDAPLRKLNNLNTLNVKVVNHSDKSKTNVEIQLNLEDYERTQLLDIPANSSETTTFTFTDKTSGVKKGKVEVNDDQLYFDDTYYFSYEVQEKANITMINGESASNIPHLVYETDPFYALFEMPSTQLQVDKIKNSDVVVLNELNEIPSGLFTPLEDFLSNGGSLIIIPSFTCDIGSYNTLLNRFKLPLIAQKNEQKTAIKKILMDAPFFNGVFDSKDRQLNLPSVLSYFKGSVQQSTTFIPLVSFENESPYFVKNRGDQNVFLFYAGATENFGNASKHALFSTLLLRSAEMSLGNKPLSIILGSNQSYPVQLKGKQDEVVHIKDGATIDFIPPTYKKGKFNYISMKDEDLISHVPSGNYGVFSDQIKVDIISLNQSPKESYNQVLNENEIASKLQRLGVNNIQFQEIEDITDIEQITLEKQPEYWRFLLFLALVFFLLETLLLKLWKV